MCSFLQLTSYHISWKTWQAVIILLLDILVVNQWTTNVTVYLWTLNSIPLICLFSCHYHSIYIGDIHILEW